MKQKRFRLIRSLIALVLVIGMIFVTPAQSAIAAAGGEDITNDEYPPWTTIADSSEIYTLTEGNNVLPTLTSLKWSYSVYEYDYRLGKVTIPAKKAITFDSAKLKSYAFLNYYLFQNGDCYNGPYSVNISYSGDISLYENSYYGEQLFRVSNFSDQAVTYYIPLDSVAEIEIGFHDVVDNATVYVHSNYPKGTDAEEKCDSYEFSTDYQTPIYIKNSGFYCGEDYYLSGWHDSNGSYETSEAFFPPENGEYHIYADWTAYTYYDVTLNSNFPESWGKEAVSYTKRYRENDWVSTYDFNSKFDGIDGYYPDHWYMLDENNNEVSVYGFDVTSDIQLYIAWQQTDLFRMCRYSGYPEECELDDLVDVQYAYPDEGFYNTLPFDVPTGYKFAGWKDKDGNVSTDDYIESVNANGTFTATWEKIPKVTFHSNYPAILGLEDETCTEYDYGYGDGVYLSEYFNYTDNRVYISGWSLTKGGESIGMWDSVEFDEDTDLYAIWHLPNLSTTTFYSAYPEEWSLTDQTVTLTERLSGGFDMSEITFKGKDGNTIVGWENEFGSFFTNEDFEEGQVYATEAYAVWSNRPKISISTNYPAETGFENKVIVGYTKKNNMIYLASLISPFDYEYSISKFVDTKTGVEYPYNYSETEFTSSANLKTIWQKNKKAYVNYVSPTGATGSTDTIYSGSNGLFYLKTDSEGSKVISSYKDKKGNVYPVLKNLDIADGTVLTPVWSDVVDSKATLYSNYPEEAVIIDEKGVEHNPSTYSCSMTSDAYCNVVSLSSEYEYEFGTVCGYKFAGWNTKADGTGENVDAYELYTEQDINLYAQWKYTSSINMITQPSDKTAYWGGTVNLATKAEGSDLEYQWQVSSDYGTTWKNSSATGAKTAKLTFKASKSLDGRRFRCKITSGKDVIYTKTATLTTMSVISGQTTAYSSIVGSTAIFKVNLKSTAAKCQWEVSTDSGKNWKNSGATGNTTATLSVKATAAMNGYQFRCKVTYGNWSGYTTPAKLTIIPAITAEPEDTTVVYGDVARFDVKATGVDLQYQWQLYNGTKWVNSTTTSGKSASLRVTSTKTMNGKKYRCKITSGSKVIYSREVTLTTKTCILNQPANKTVKAGAKAVFTVSATGKKLSYQWQVCKNGTDWENLKITGYNTNQLTIAKATAKMNGYKYRCVVTNGSVKVNTKTVTLTVK